MTTMELKYSSDQQHQIEAVEAITDLFRGQEFLRSEFTAEMGASGTLMEGQVLSVGHANGLRLSANQLLENLHDIQEENSLPATAVMTDGRLRDFTVEMETGTGKTYVYTRTIFELNKRYGITKYLIVVPSVAIREGVLKSFRSTRKHFATLYDNAPMDVFVYDSKDMGPVGNFATSSSIQVMIINIQAFNRDYSDEGNVESSSLFHRPSERLIGGRSPREVVAACNPIVIIDEPQSVDNTAKAKAAIRSLNPLFVLRYSATHKEAYNKVYRLTPVDAFQQGLVKGICVDSVLAQADLNGSYVRLESTRMGRTAGSITARLTIDVRQRDGSQKRKTVTVRTGTNLFDQTVSGENTDYEAGWIVSNISAAEGDEWIEFQNGEYIELGQAVGDVAEEAVKRAQIRRTIEDHLQRQLELTPRGIKVLSLFFIDKVEKYRQYDPVRNGEYAEMFEQEYADALESFAPPVVWRHWGKRRLTWRECYELAGIPLEEDAAAIHSGYFSQDGRGRIKNTSASASSAADISTFETIMREKETLISFPSDGDDEETRAKKRIQFIWSHSALKEGWDNPNVFQICTLVETKDTMTKRQKVGRGLRLCVDQDGERCYDDDANVLTVIANESYDAFANGLQTEFEKDGLRFGVLTPESFTKVSIELVDGQEVKLGYEQSAEVYQSLVAKGLVDEKGNITPELKEAAEKGCVEMPEGLESIKSQVEDIILHKAQRLPVTNKQQEVLVELDQEVAADPAFLELWDRIRRRTRFEVDVDSEKLIAAAVEGIKVMPTIKAPEILSTRADLSVDDSGVGASATGISTVKTGGARAYELPDPISELKDVVGLTRATLKRILEECGRFDEFEIDPATFLAQVAQKIEKAKGEAIAEGIKYTRLPEEDWYKMEDLDPGELKAYLGQNAWMPSGGKSLYSYVVYDSSTVEQPFAAELDLAEEVRVFAKLPDRFKIDTPLSSYNPDWAYVVEEDGVQRVYFVVETKGGGNNSIRVSDAERTKIECARRHFEALGVDVEYDVRTTYRA
ncbi:MAG: DEAD/DEAH box helicase family protein [Atopobiaceae bacterium]|nr:DEAD/DEAH box helicase family protein [Atopobiaceae bacterium]MBR3314294.1 DEAD/DEAH box helicase family protein [Atopobiaceae bacterium]